LANRILSQAVVMRRFGEPDVTSSPSRVDALLMMTELAPSNVMESMLAVQMSGVHEAAIAFLRAGGRPGLGEKQRNTELRRSRELMQLYVTQLDSMRRLNGQDMRRRRK
jgi:hypothetical protein